MTEPGLKPHFSQSVYTKYTYVIGLTSWASKESSPVSSWNCDREQQFIDLEAPVNYCSQRGLTVVSWRGGWGRRWPLVVAHTDCPNRAARSRSTDRTRLTETRLSAGLARDLAGSGRIRTKLPNYSLPFLRTIHTLTRLGETGSPDRVHTYSTHRIHFPQFLGLCIGPRTAI